MLAIAGSVLIGLALIAAWCAVLSALGAARWPDSHWAPVGRYGTFAAATLLALALGVLLAAFLGDRFDLRYVAQHASRALPLYLKASAVWAGQEGSLLLWSFLQALFAALVVGRPSARSRSLLPWATVFLGVITAFFVAVTLFLCNPFTRSAGALPDGYGLNPLLRHPAMVFHPPALYLGYVGLAVPFALGLAALVTRQVDAWPAAARRWTLAAWLFLGLGLLLGARWAYDVLGWGGYWGWDPVENAGLMPWLTATALLHGMAMQEQRGGFRVWNLLLSVVSFALVLFGAFTTRSGLIQSVHAFSRSQVGPVFLAFIGVALVGSLVLLYSRRSVLADPHPPENLFSREGMFLLTLTILGTVTGSVWIGSVLPTLTGALTGQRFEAGPAWFDRVTGPQFAGLVLLMGVCPLLGRAAGGLGRRWRRGLAPLAGAGIATAAAALAGFGRPASLVGFAVVGLAGGTALAEIGRAAAVFIRREGGGLGRTFRRLVGRRRYGGYLVHVGVVLMAVGIIGTRFYSLGTEVRLLSGEPVKAGDYALVYQGLEQEWVGDRLSTWASIAVYRNDVHLTTLWPRVDEYRYLDSVQTVTVPALRMGLREDLYLFLSQVPEGWGASVKIVVNPLINFLWLGGLAFLAGGVVAYGPDDRGP